MCHLGDSALKFLYNVKSFAVSPPSWSPLYAEHLPGCECLDCGPILSMPMIPVWADSLKYVVIDAPGAGVIWQFPALELATLAVMPLLTAA